MKKRIILPLIMLSLGLFGLGSCDFPIISSQESTPESSSEPASSSETTSSSQESTSSSEIVITHNYGTSWEKDETHHWHACSDEDCNEISDKAVHSGGTATEEAKAVCEVCGESYGSLKPHEHAYTVELAAEEYLVSEADCDSKAVYYKSCSCGEKGTETFEYGEVLGHDYDTLKSNETHHWDECSCGVKTNEEEHEYSIPKSDSTNHWDECECGVKANEEAHDYVADKNETHHWKECECGEEVEKEEHKYTYAYTKDEETLKYTGVCACGHAVSGDVSGDTLEVSTEADLKMVLSSNYNVVLANDIALTSTIVLDGEIDVTIDLNGNSLILHKEEPELNERVEVFLVKNNVKLTIEGEGNVSATVSEDSEVSCYVEVLSAIDGAKVTIKGGSYYSNGCTAIYATRGAIIDIYGGTFEASIKWNGNLFTLDVNEAETNIGIINVYGGTYVNFDPANHTNDGENYTNKVQEGYCSVKDGDNYVVEEHVVVTDEAVEETCTTDGKTEGSHCSRCNHVFVAQEVVPAIGHDYKQTVTEPTCTEKGYTTHTCEVCGDSFTDTEVPANGHSFTVEEVDAKYLAQAADCENAAKYYKLCSECDIPSTSEDDTFVSGTPLGHDDSGTWLESEDKTAHYKICGREGCGEELDYGTHDGTSNMTTLAKCSACGKEHGKYQVTVSYLNTNNWEKVYAYAWTAESHLVDWPGVEIQKGTNFYDYHIESETSLEGLKVIFSNGSGSQTADLVISEGYAVFYGNSNIGYNFKDENHMLTVYFTKPADDWGDTIKAHMWIDGGKGTNWPGADAPWVEMNSYGKHVYSVQFDMAEYTKIIFNNNNGGKQTSDLVVPGDGSNAVYWDDGSSSWVWTKDTSH